MQISVSTAHAQALNEVPDVRLSTAHLAGKLNMYMSDRSRLQLDEETGQPVIKSWSKNDR